MKTLVLAIGALVLVLAYQEAQGQGNYFNRPIIMGQTCVLVNLTTGLAFCVNVTSCPNYTECTLSDRTCPGDTAVITFTCALRSCDETNPCPSGSVCRDRNGEKRCAPTSATFLALYRGYNLKSSRQTCGDIRQDVCFQRR